MKITKYPDEYDMNVYYRDKALKECKVCPCCGEPDDFHINKGILQYACRYELVRTGIFKREHMKISLFKCMSCGARWESDPYKEV